MKIAVAAAVGAGLLALGLACERAQEPPPEPAASPVSARTAGEEPDPAALLQPGQFRVEVLDGRVLLLARQAPRSAVFRELAIRAGFVAEGPEPRAALLDLSLEDSSAGDAVAEVLSGLVFELAYEPDPLDGRPHLAVVRLQADEIGAAAEVAAAEPEPDAAGEGGEQRLLVEPGPDDYVPPFEPTSTHLGVPWYTADQVYATLDDSDPRARRWAVDHLDPNDGDDLPRLIDRTLHDEDPDVRAMGLDRLSLTESVVGVSAILVALEDPDPGVVLKAIESLEFAGDEHLTPKLEPLLSHRDEPVRKAAKEAIEFLD